MGKKFLSTSVRQSVSQFHASFFFENFSGGSRIFLGSAIYHQSGCANLIVYKFFAENSMKMKELGPQGPVTGASLGSVNEFAKYTGGSNPSITSD